MLGDENMSGVVEGALLRGALIVTRVLWLFVNALLFIFAIAAFASFVPSIPALGSLGPLLISPYGPWISIFALVGAVANFWRWQKFNKRSALIPAMLACFAFAGTLFIQMQQISVAAQNGLAINVLRTLWLGDEQYKSPEPVVQTYGRYGKNDLPLAIYRPAPSQALSLAPIIVYVHGGGWGAGSLHDRASDMRWLADRGYLVISVEYSLAAADHPTWDIAQKQVGCALMWIASNAQQFGGDGSRVALFGESAGGNLVLNVAYLASSGALTPMCDGKLPNIAATIAGYPIIDALKMYQNQDVIAGRFARMMTTHYTGGTPDEYPERYLAINANTHIHSSAPPTLLLPALADHLLPPSPVYAFAEQAKAAGVDVRVIGFPYGEHSFDQRNGSIGSQLVRGATLQFLAEFGLAPSE